MKKKLVAGFLALGAVLVTWLTLPGTPGSATKEAPWRFAVLCDTRSNPCADPGGGAYGVNIQALDKLAKAVAAEQVDVVLVPGDVALGNGYECKPPTPGPNSAKSQYQLWRKVMQPVYDSYAKVLPVRGNHEMDRDAIMSDWSSCRKRIPVEYKLLTAYKKVFNDPYIPENGPESEKKLTYSYPHKNALFVGFDQITDQFENNQSWFEQVLKKDKREHLFVFGHYPAFAVKHKDCLACYSSARDRFWDAIGGAGGRMYFCGHDHFYDRAVIADSKGNPIQQVLVGNGGAPFAHFIGPYMDKKVSGAEHIENVYGYVVVTVDGAKVSSVLKVLDAQSGAWVEKDTFGYETGK
jgi:hypothetical protein